MRLAVLAVALGATVLGTLPAAAEVVVRDRGDAVVIRQGVHHPRWWHHRAECRTIKTRKHLPNGNVIVKTRRVCD